MSHQPFPKKGANLIKNTDSLKDSQVTYSTCNSEHNTERSASYIREQEIQTSQACLLKARYSGSNTDAIRHTTASTETQLAAGLRKQQEGRAQQPEREGVNVGGMKREEEADLGHRNKPRADTGSRRFLQRLSCLQTQREDPRPNSEPWVEQSLCQLQGHTRCLCRDALWGSQHVACRSLHRPLLLQMWLAAATGSWASSAAVRRSPARQCMAAPGQLFASPAFLSPRAAMSILCPQTSQLGWGLSPGCQNMHLRAGHMKPTWAAPRLLQHQREGGRCAHRHPIRSCKPPQCL